MRSKYLNGLVAFAVVTSIGLETGVAVHAETIISTSQAASIVQSNLSDFVVDATTTTDDVKAVASQGIDDPGIIIQVSSIETMIPATTENTGLASIVISIQKDGQVTQALDLNKPIAKLEAQGTIDPEKQAILDRVKNNYDSMGADNFITSDFVLSVLEGQLADTGYSPQISDFTLEKATESAPGSVTFTVTGIKNETDTISEEITEEIPMLSPERASYENTVSAVQNFLDDYEPTNDSSQQVVTEEINNIIAGSGVSAIIYQYNLISADASNSGELSFCVNLSDSSVNGLNDLRFQKDIAKLPAVQTKEDLDAAIQQLSGSYSVSNSTTQEELQSAANSIVENMGLSVEVTAFNKIDATTFTPGSIGINYKIIDSSDNSILQNSLSMRIAQLQAVQTSTDLENAIRSYVTSNKAFNSTTREEVQEAFNNLVTNRNLVVNVNNFQMMGATNSTPGTIDVGYNIKNNGTTVANDLVTFNIDPLSATQTLQSLAGDFAVERANLVFTNDTTATDIENHLKTFITNPNLTVRVEYNRRTAATETTAGQVYGSIYITDTSLISQNQTEVDFLGSIPQLGNSGGTNDGQSAEILNNAEEIARQYLNNYVPSNGTTLDDIKNRITSAINDDRVLVNINNFNLHNANYSSTGSCSFVVRLSVEDAVANIDYSHGIDKLVSSGSASSHSSGSSSSHNSSSSNNSISNSNSSTGLIAVVHNQASSTVATTTSIGTSAPIIAPEVAREKVVSTLSDIAGTNAKVEVADTKKVKTTDGSFISVSKVVSNGTYTGSVIVSDKSYNSVAIPLETDGNKIDEVYKYVPLVGKYMPVTDIAAIADGTITIPTQEKATYLATTSPLPIVQVVSKGWTQVDNNWFLVSPTGDPKLGWQQDSTNQWVYLDQSNAVMKTGWIKDGSNWYHLGNNGYMSTGWLKDNNDGKWYYLNQDGSMAYDTTVDGYNLDSHGAWIE